MMLSTEETFMPLMPVQISFFGGKKNQVVGFLLFALSLYFLMSLSLFCYWILVLLRISYFHKKLGEGESFAFVAEERYRLLEGKHVSTSLVK